MLEPVFMLGHMPLWGHVPWIMLALLTHSAALASPLLSLLPMRSAVAGMREELHRYFWNEYDVDLIDDKPAPAAKPEPKPDKEPEAAEPEAKSDPRPEAPKPPPPAKPPDKEEEDPYDGEPPPAPAEAADVLTGDKHGEEDLTGFTIVDKDGSKSSGGGYTSAEGTAKGPVHDKNARNGGTPGGKGTGPVTHPKKPKPNLARPPALLGGHSWSCPFPPQADVEQVDRATAVVAITVGPDGRAKSVRVVSDPGYGFGAAARRCALARRYQAAHDAGGRAITSTMPPVRVHFRR